VLALGYTARLSNQCTSLSQTNKTQEDEKRKLTPLGARQAELTGQRLAEILKGVLEEEGRGRPCSMSLRVSCLTRARETAAIIATFLPRLVTVVEACDGLLNEGRPCHHIPCATVSERVVQATGDSHPRIEQAFQKYFYRADYNKQADAADGTESTKEPWNLPSDFEDDSIVAAVVDTADKEPPRHEFEIIVCHANVIRYFLCRALQLPPEAWLRFCPFNCSLTYLTIRPTGTVSYALWETLVIYPTVPRPSQVTTALTGDATRYFSQRHFQSIENGITTSCLRPCSHLSFFDIDLEGCTLFLSLGS
jgi:serine/threonine-protein phosphatase PGAM5